MTYSDFVAALANLAVRQPTNPDFVGILPRAIEYAEGRIYRDLDFAATSQRNTGFALAAGSRDLALPVGTFVVIDSVNVLPVGGAPGARTQLVRISWDVLDAMFGGPAPAGRPSYYALSDSATLAVGPWPDQAYPLEIWGTVRPAPLSAANPTTLLSLYLPDLFLASAMIFVSGWMRNFGQQSDDPRMAASWEAQYGLLVKSAAVEEARKKAIAIPGDL